MVKEKNAPTFSLMTLLPMKGLLLHLIFRILEISVYFISLLCFLYSLTPEISHSWQTVMRL